MGILDGVPEGDGIRMEWCIALAAGCRIPQIGIVAGVDAGTTAHDLFSDTGDEQLTVSAVHHAAEEGIVGDKASGLEPVVTSKELRESLELLFRLYVFRRGSALDGILYASHLTIADALFRRA